MNAEGILSVSIVNNGRIIENVSDKKIQKIISNNVENFIEVCDKEMGCYTFDTFLYSYVAKNGFVYIAVSAKNISTYVVIQLLKDIQEAKDGGNKNMRGFIEGKIKEYNEMPGDKIKAIEKELEQVKEIAIENIKRLEERGVKINDLNAKVEDLENTTVQFEKNAGELKRITCLNSLRNKILLGVGIAAVIAIIIIIIYFSVCGGGKCSSTPAPK